jgi:hypothetical protein
MRSMHVAVLMLALSVPTVAIAQDDVQIVIGGFSTPATGGEKSEGISHRILPTLGKAFAAEWSMRDCGYFRLSVGNDGFEEGATDGWRIEVTPIRVVNRAVTFRLRRSRALVNGRPIRAETEDLELTMRPGESRTIDRASVRPGSKTFDGRPCGTSEVALRLSVDDYPSEDFERRLVATDLWLVERLPNGGERSLPVSVRGLPHKPVAFYFDSITDGTSSLDILGRVVARPGAGTLELSLQVRSRWGDTARRDGEWPTQWVETRVDVRPDEVVEVALPRLGDAGGPFANRLFSLRVRARQLR